MREEVTRANPATVEAGLQHLLKAYNEFVEAYPGTVTYPDGFMIAHNFHVYLILDLEEKIKARPADQLWLRRLAKDTFEIAMEEKP